MSEWSIFAKAMLKERKDILLSIGAGFVAGIAGVALFSMSGYLIAKTVFLPPLYTLILLASLVKLLGLTRAASRYGERMYSHRATFSLLSRLRTTFFARLIPLAPDVLSRQRSGDLLARIVGDVESLQFYFLRVAYPPMIVISVFLATVIFTSFFSIWIALLFVLGMILIAFVVPAVIRKGQYKQQGAVRKLRARFSTEAAEMMYGFMDLKAYGRLYEREQQLEQVSRELTTMQQKDAVRLLRGQSLHALTTFIMSWGVLALGAWLIVNGSMEGIFLAMLIMTSMTVFDESAAMATLPAYKQDSEFAAKRLNEVVPQTPPIEETTGSLQLQDDMQVSINMENVWFRYADDWRWTLQDISLSLPAGSKTAIVGASGSGKTSLLELMLKLHTADRGQIALNGMPIGELNADSIWKQSRVVLQQGHFFRGTLRDNLLLDHDDLSDDLLMNMLQQVELAHKKLDDLLLEKGENWSDGEKQRLALVRAFLKPGQLWLLDEPTSSLDYVTERRILDLLLERAQDATLVMVSHRLTGLERMDQIVVMDQGKIVEVGTYDELMKQQGYFYELKQLELELIG